MGINTSLKCYSESLPLRTQLITVLSIADHKSPELLIMGLQSRQHFERYRYCRFKL